MILFFSWNRQFTYFLRKEVILHWMSHNFRWLLINLLAEWNKRFFILWRKIFYDKNWAKICLCNAMHGHNFVRYGHFLRKLTKLCHYVSKYTVGHFFWKSLKTCPCMRATIIWFLKLIWIISPPFHTFRKVRSEKKFKIFTTTSLQVKMCRNHKIIGIWEMHFWR